MARSTEVQKAERLNAAHSLLSGGVTLAEAVQVLSRHFGLSRRQAYRYLQEAQEIGHSVAVVEPSVPITLKVPGNIVRDLRAYSSTSGQTLGEIVARAVTGFLATVRERG
jgi:predicted DNA-binding transcriptional regulator YafY